jgi:uncharacterized membrane protein YgcG
MIALRHTFARHFFISSVLLTLALLSLNQIAYASTEAIDDFEANIAIQKDGTVLIGETIIYNFGTNQKHGIFRDIPLTAENGPQLNINVLSVNNELGQSYQYTTSINNDVLRVKIGDPNAFISGIKTYVINYQVYNAIRTFSDHDELYWNVTGNQWPVAIRNAVASITLPDPSLTNIRMDCFTGYRGSTQKNCAFNNEAGVANFSINQLLNANEGLTIVVGIPKGYINNIYASPTTSSQVKNNWSGSFILGLFGLFFILIFGSIIRAYLKRGKPLIPKELRNHPIVVQYAPPQGLTPTDTGAIFDGNLDNADLASVIIDLAVRGYLKIRYISDDDYEFIRLKDLSGLAHPAYKIIFNFLFVSRDTVKLSELENARASFDKDRILYEMKEYLQSSGYLKDLNEKDPRVRKYYLSRYAAIILTIFVISYAALFFGFGGFQKLGLGGMVFLVFFCGIFSVVIGLFIIAAIFGKPVYGRLAPPGIEALGVILGFKEFLRATETDKLKLLNAPELKPELFDRYLPYAMALGVEKEWAKKFEGLYQTPPVWFEGPVGAFSATALVGHLSRFNNSFNQTIASHSSGFSGGSSGGGSGGGGGGSW